MNSSYEFFSINMYENICKIEVTISKEDDNWYAGHVL